MNISIDQELKNLIPPLTKEEYAGLEESILNEGCRDAIVLWGETIIDGLIEYHDKAILLLEFKYADEEDKR